MIAHAAGRSVFDLSLLSYFNSYGTGIRVADMIRRILADTSLVEDYGHLADFRLNLALLKVFPRTL